MNKHIKKLAQEAFNDFEKKPVIINKPKDLQIFAELIINECISTVYDSDFGNKNLDKQVYYMDKVADQITKHFGIN